MTRARPRPAEIVSLLRWADARDGKGTNVAGATRQLGVREDALCRSRQECGAMCGNQFQRLEELEVVFLEVVQLREP